MTPLVDTIRRAFEDAVLDADGDVVPTTAVVEAIELYVKAEDTRGILEGIVDEAFAETRRAWGPTDWRHQSHEVTERIISGIEGYATATGIA